MKPEYDVVIIGAGIGGLTAAALLSKAGYSVCVLEKEPHAGGYLAGFSRKDFRFDTAIHWLNQCAPGGIVDKIFSILGSDHPKAISQKRIRRYLSKNHNYLLTDNPDQLRQAWTKEFPEDREGIELFFRAAKKIGAAFANFRSLFRTEESMTFIEKLKNKWPLLKFGTAFIPYLRFSGEKGFGLGLNKFFKAQKLKDVFAADCELIGCMVPIGWAYFGDYQSPPEGGSQVMPEWLQHIVRFYKNELLFNCSVQKIVLANGTATGVQVKQRNNSYHINAKHIIAACDAETLYNKMLPQHVLSEKFRAKLQQAEIYSSSVTLSIALDCTAEALNFNEELIHIAGQNAYQNNGEELSPHNVELSILAPSARDKSLAAEGKGTLTIYAPALMSYKNNWQTVLDEDGNYQRTEAYKKLKHEFAAVILQRVEELVAPGLQSHILFYEIATPITHWRYTGNKDGSMMGAKPGRKNMQQKIAHYQTPVKNVLLGGHWAELGGGVPIAVKAGTNAALLILKKENKRAFKLLANYMDGKISDADFLEAGIFNKYDNSWERKPTPSEKAVARKVDSTAD